MSLAQELATALEKVLERKAPQPGPENDIQLANFVLPSEQELNKRVNETIKQLDEI